MMTEFSEANKDPSIIEEELTSDTTQDEKRCDQTIKHEIDVVEPKKEDNGSISVEKPNDQKEDELKNEKEGCQILKKEEQIIQEILNKLALYIDHDDIENFKKTFEKELCNKPIIILKKDEEEGKETICIQKENDRPQVSTTLDNNESNSTTSPMQKKDQETISDLETEMDAEGEEDYEDGEENEEQLGNTLLHLSCCKGSTASRSIIEFLLENRGDLKMKNNLGATPIHYAFQNINDLEFLKYLVSQVDGDLHMTDNFDENLLHYASKGTKILENNISVIKFLVGDLKFPVNKRNLYGWTALHCLCASYPSLISPKNQSEDENPKKPLENNILDISSYLLENGADVNSKNKTCQTPLHFACIRSGLPLVKLLVEKGNADLNSKDYWGKTPLHDACKANYIPVVRYILENKHQNGVNINAVDTYGATSLHDACEQEDGLEMVSLLLDNGALANISDVGKRTPFQIAKDPKVKQILSSKLAELTLQNQQKAKNGQKNDEGKGSRLEKNSLGNSSYSTFSHIEPSLSGSFFSTKKSSSSFSMSSRNHQSTHSREGHCVPEVRDWASASNGIYSRFHYRQSMNSENSFTRTNPVFLRLTMLEQKIEHLEKKQVWMEREMTKHHEESSNFGNILGFVFVTLQYIADTTEKIVFL